MRKNPWNKHQILEKWDDFENRPSCKGYRLCKMVSLGQKLEWPKTCQKRFYKHMRNVLCKKTAGKNTNYSRNETILKIGHLAKAIDFAKWSVWVKNWNGQKHAKNDSTSTLQFSVHKTPWENTNYSKNETILKIGHLTKAIDFVKWSVWIQN